MDLIKITKEQRQEMFNKELKALLTKFDVELNVEDNDDRPFNEEMVIFANFNSQIIGDEFVEFSEVNMGTWIDGSEK